MILNDLDTRRRLTFIAAEIVRRAKLVNMEMPSGAWEAPLLGERGRDGVSLMEVLFALPQHTVHKLMSVLIDPNFED